MEQKAMKCPECGSDLQKELDWPDEPQHWHCGRCGHEEKVKDGGA